MANFITKIIDRSIERIANKSHTVSFTPSNHNTYDLIRDYFNYGNKSTYDLKRLLDTYENHPLVFEVIDNITQSVSRIPLKVETSTGQEVINSRVLEMFTPQLKEQIVSSQESCGNAFLYLRKGIGMGEELVFWVASDVDITTSTSTGKVTQYQYTDCKTNKITTVQGDDLKYVIHLKNPKITSVGEVEVGLSKLTPMWDVVEASKEKFSAEKSIFKNRGVASIISNDSDIPLLPEAREAQQREFNKNTGGADKFNGTYVTSNRVKLIQMGMSPTDLKLIEGITESLRRLASAYHLSSVLFNDVANSKFDNMEEAIKQAYINCYIPTAEKIYTPLFVWLSELLGVDEVPSVDKSEIEVIRASTNRIAMLLDPFEPKIQEMLISQLTKDEARELLELDGIENGNEQIGNSNTTSNEGQGNA